MSGPDLNSNPSPTISNINSIHYERDGAGNVIGKGEMEIEGKIYSVSFSLGNVDTVLNDKIKNEFQSMIRNLIHSSKTMISKEKGLQIKNVLNESSVLELVGQDHSTTTIKSSLIKENAKKIVDFIKSTLDSIHILQDELNKKKNENSEAKFHQSNLEVNTD
jgi:hypothetical protein